MEIILGSDHRAQHCVGGRRVSRRGASKQVAKPDEVRVAPARRARLGPVHALDGAQDGLELKVAHDRGDAAMVRPDGH